MRTIDANEMDMEKFRVVYGYFTKPQDVVKTTCSALHKLSNWLTESEPKQIDWDAFLSHIHDYLKKGVYIQDWVEYKFVITFNFLESIQSPRKSLDHKPKVYDLYFLLPNEPEVEDRKWEKVITTCDLDEIFLQILKKQDHFISGLEGVELTELEII